LLRNGQAYALNANAQPEPPDRELCSKLKSAWAEAKGTPLSLRMLAGKAALLKKPFKHGKA